MDQLTFCNMFVGTNQDALHISWKHSRLSNANIYAKKSGLYATCKHLRSQKLWSQSSRAHGHVAASNISRIAPLTNVFSSTKIFFLSEFQGRLWQVMDDVQKGLSGDLVTIRWSCHYQVILSLSHINTCNNINIHVLIISYKPTITWYHIIYDNITWYH